MTSIIIIIILVAETKNSKKKQELVERGELLYFLVKYIFIVLHIFKARK